MQFPFNGLLSNTEATEACGVDFGGYLLPGHRVALHGDLGAGKTTFCRGVCRALGFRGGVHSPTYAIVHEYPNQPPIFHVDLYRLGERADLTEIGLDELATRDGVTLLEWPERMGDRAMVDWDVELRFCGNDEREIHIRRSKP